MFRKPIFFIAITVLCMSCSRDASQQTKQKSEYDSILWIKSQIEKEMDAYFLAISEIEDNLERIQELENIISFQSTGEEISNDYKSNIHNKLQIINQLLDRNASKIEQMRENLAKSSLKINNLEKTVTRLAQKIKGQMEQIEILQYELEKKDNLISQRDIAIKGLSENLDELHSRSKQQEQIIEKQKDSINTAWYVFGTYKELKRQQILTSNGFFSPAKVLQDSFSNDYFIKIDVRTTTEIPLYTKQRVRIRTTHPKESFQIEKQDGLYLLKITDPNKFWKVSRYLVMEID